MSFHPPFKEGGVLSIIADRPGSSNLKEGKHFSPSQKTRRGEKVFASVVSKPDECKGYDNLLANPLPRRYDPSSRSTEQGVDPLAGWRKLRRELKPLSCAPGYPGSPVMPRSQRYDADMGLACIKSHIITKNPYIPLYDNKTDIELYPGMIRFRRENKEKENKNQPQ